MTAPSLVALDLPALVERYADPFDAIQVLDPDGTVVDAEALASVEPETLVSLMEDLVWAHAFDERMVLLNRQGALGNYAPAGGQEASQFATRAALVEGDFLVPTYRDLAPLIRHGLPMHQAFLWWKGHVAGNQLPADFPAWMPQVIVGGQVPHAAGVALGKKLKGEPHVVLAYCGDGATSQGDFYEGLNVAAVYDAPLIVVVQNNLYAISVPVSKQTRAATLAQKAVAVGCPALRIDGNDPVALLVGTRLARRHALAHGPVVIEALTYRTGNHTMSDDARRYRTDEEVEGWVSRSSLHRLRTHLTREGLWSADREDEIAEEVRQTMKAELAVMAQTPPMTVSQLLGHMYEVPPATVAEQQERYAAKEGR